MDNLVWYTSYGSNLLKDRFMCYIEGGRPEGGAREQVGCRDRTPPLDEAQIMIPYRLYFARESGTWENRSVAFIRSERDDGAGTQGRMYLITAEQFRDVFVQENGGLPEQSRVEIDYEKVVEQGQLVASNSWYGRVIYLGRKNNQNIFTFSATILDIDIELGVPGPKYLAVIIKGLRETYGSTREQIEEYLKGADGIKGNLSEDELVTIIRKISEE